MNCVNEKNANDHSFVFGILKVEPLYSAARCRSAVNGMTTCRLHLRHFNSTPAFTNRASKLPQQQRKEVLSLDAEAGSRSLCGSRPRIYVSFRPSRAIQSEVVMNTQSSIPWAASVSIVG
jgi:hypothetical protein